MTPVSGISAYAKIGNLQQAGANQSAQKTGSAEGSFGSLVKSFVEQTNADQINSDNAVKDLVTGKADNVQDVVMAVANAEMSFQLFMEIRNKLIDSYNELMRMQF